jgi:hypothetical protein
VQNSGLSPAPKKIATKLRKIPGRFSYGPKHQLVVCNNLRIVNKVINLFLFVEDKDDVRSLFSDDFDLIVMRLTYGYNSLKRYFLRILN